MPTKKANASTRSPQKKKATAKSNAAERANNKPRTGGKSPRAGMSEKQRSMGRFPGETPLTGEDRPAKRAGAKKQTRSAKGR